MCKTLPQMLELAAALLASETRAAEPSRAATVAICNKLRVHLSMLMGATGYRTLLARAAALAQAEFRSLRTLTIDHEGLLQWPVDTSTPPDVPDDSADGAAFIAQLFSLLVAFIGEDLTLQILKEIWPRVFARQSRPRIGESE